MIFTDKRRRNPFRTLNGFDYITSKRTPKDPGDRLRNNLIFLCKNLIFRKLLFRFSAAGKQRIVSSLNKQINRTPCQINQVTHVISGFLIFLFWWTQHQLTILHCPVWSWPSSPQLRIMVKLPALWSDSYLYYIIIWNSSILISASIYYKK